MQKLRKRYQPVSWKIEGMPQGISLFVIKIIRGALEWLYSWPFEFYLDYGGILKHKEGNNVVT